MTRRSSGAALVAVAAIAACGRSDSKQVTPNATVAPAHDAAARAAELHDAPAPPADAAAADPAALAADSGGDRSARVIPASTQQLVTAIVPDWTATTAELRLWTRDGGTWKLAKGPWPGVIGARGSAWGDGAHGGGAPAGRGGPAKREGDGKSPAGVFTLRGTYGYAGTTPTAMPYTPLDANWSCVDDAASRHYDRILDRRSVTVDWTSAEEMRRKDELYRWVVDVAHNPAHVAGAGSCIFLHVWGGARSATAGCTAMPEDRLAELIAVLEPSAMFVLLPRAEYDALAERWDLPR